MDKNKKDVNVLDIFEASISLVKASAMMSGNYESRKVGRDTAKSGITVSTAYTSDEGYETAILDSKGTYPVERYKDIRMAELGHGKWVVLAETIKEITELPPSVAKFLLERKITLVP